jgi:hypothetical protein
MKHSSKEAFYQRMRDLADVKGGLNEEKRVLGDLIDYKKGADNVNYGIVRENHHYYIKKSNKQVNENNQLGVEDFAYIGGLENITKYRYNKLSEADKQRNMILNTINEALGVTSPLINEEKSQKQILSENKKEDVDGDGDIDSDDWKAKRDAAIKKSKKEDVDESVEEGAEEEIKAAEKAMGDRRFESKR